MSETNIEAYVIPDGPKFWENHRWLLHDKLFVSKETLDTCKQSALILTQTKETKS